MGASTSFRVFPDMPEAQLIQKVAEVQQSAAFESGHCYSGDWGSKPSGVCILKEVFLTEHAAQGYITEENDKWDMLMAARFHEVRPDSALSRKMAQLQQKRGELHQIANGDSQARAALSRVRAQAAKTRGCKHCGSSIAVSHIHSVHCPVCREVFLLTPQDLKKQEAAKQKLDLLTAQETALLKTNANGRNLPLKWLVGGWCPS